MLKKTILVLSVATFVAGPIEAIASAKKGVEPTGAEHKHQYEIVLKDCRKKYGNDAIAEWGGYYGKSGWWCKHRF
ncbi:MAG: hypothetical protein ABIN69_17910 [Aestuariivirga sp.]